MKFVAVLITSLSLVHLAGSVSARAQGTDPSVETFFRGRTMTLTIGYGPGGGYDLYGRLAARHLGRHIPGNPTIVPKNQPSAGSLLLANQLYNSLPRDGSQIGIISNSLPLEQLLGSPQIMFDSSKFNWIGRFDDLSLVLIAWQASGIATVEDVIQREFSIAVPGRGSSGEFALSAIKKLLGTKYKLISGYRSGQETKLAMERGEVDATASIQWSTLKVVNHDWIEQKKIIVLVQLGLDPISDLPNTPLAPDLARTDEQRRIIELLMLPARVGRALVAPPDLPADRLAAIRKGFDQMLSDPEFLADARRSNLTLNPLAASSLQELIARISKTDPALLKQTKAVTDNP